MFEEYGFLELFSIPRDNLLRFLYNIRVNYHPNEYHNYRHAADVMHACYIFTTCFGAASYLTHTELFALLIAAICHDVDHPGLNNIFQVNSQSKLAMRYNDISVLENYHCACIFEISRDPKCNIFGGIMPNEYKYIRKMIIEAIFQTDMAHHFDLIAKFSARLQKPEPWSKESTQDKQLLVNVLLHTADLSNAMKLWKLSKSWSMHVQEEFFQQGDKEKLMELPISMFMDRNKSDQAQMSLNFIDFIVEPLIAGLKQLLPETQLLINRLHFNKQHWSEIEEEKHRMEQQLAGSSEKEGHQNEHDTGASDADKVDAKSSDSGSVVEKGLDTMNQPQELGESSTPV